MIRVPDSILGVLFVFGGIAISAVGWNLPGLGGLPVGPGLMPMLIGFGFVGFGAALVIQGLPELDAVRRGTYRVLEERANPWFPIVVLVALVAYVPLLYPIGFVPLTVLFIAVVVRASGARLLSSVLFAVTLTAIIYLFFYYLLRVPLPAGLLAGG